MNACPKTWFIIILTPIFLLITPMTNRTLAQETLVLNTSITSPLSNETQTGFVDLVVGEALKQLGYTLKSVLLPAERALINANAGIDDGELLRIAGLQQIYTNLIQVPEKIIDMEFVVFTRHASFKVEGWNSLKPYAVAFNTGWKILERNVPDTLEKTLLNNEYQLFSVLMKDRTDVIIYSRWLGLGYIQQAHLQGVKMLLPPLARRGMYVYLHKKHARLVTKLAEALREMKTNGRYQAIFKEVLGPYCEESHPC